MKKSVITTTTFDPATRVIDTGIQDFNIKKLYAIINQSSETIIFATGMQGKGFASITGSSITLEYDTTSMNSNDVLQIIYDDNEDTELLQNIFEAVDMLTFLQTLRTTVNTLRVSVNDGSISSINSIGASTLNVLQPSTNITGIASPISIGTSAVNLAIHNQNMSAIQSNLNNISIT